jgi:predicted enzyme related to lactoylglutathione lyase
MGRVVHFEIHAQDPDRAEAFYTGVFGWTVQRYGGPVDYRLLTTGPDDEIGINGAILKPPHDMSTAPGQPVNAFVCTIAVDSIEDTERAVTEAGGTIAVERQEVPGVGQLTYVLDPEGNVFGVLQPIPPSG